MDKGKGGKESFFIVDSPSDDEDTCEDPHEKHHVSEANTNRNDLHDFIEDKIKREVKLALDYCLKSDISQTSPNKNPTHANELLIATLREEITFLRNELQSKDEIIKLIIKDKDACDVKSKLKIHEKSSVENVVNSINANNRKHKISDELKNVGDKNNGAHTEIKVDDTNTNTNKQKSITILGDSIIKNIESHKMRKCMINNEKVYVKSFPGATVKCMEDYIKPSMNFNPDVVLIHIGTNSLRSQETPETLANRIISLAEKTKTDETDVIVSGIVERNDSLNQKALEVNNFIKDKCLLNDISFCDNSNISKSYHTNGSGLHLNYKGTVTLANNFLRCLNK